MRKKWQIRIFFFICKTNLWFILRKDLRVEAKGLVTLTIGQYKIDDWWKFILNNFNSKLQQRPHPTPTTRIIWGHMSIHLALKSECGAAWHTQSLLANLGSRGEHRGKLPYRNCPWCWSRKRFSPSKTLKSSGWHFNAFYCISILFSEGSL